MNKADWALQLMPSLGNLFMRGIQQVPGWFQINPGPNNMRKEGFELNTIR